MEVVGKSCFGGVLGHMPDCQSLKANGKSKGSVLIRNIGMKRNRDEVRDEVRL